VVRRCTKQWARVRLHGEFHTSGFGFEEVAENSLAVRQRGKLEQLYL